MLDAQSANARATFYEEVEGGGDSDSPYDDPDDDWEPVHEEIPVLYEPQGTSFVNQETGDHIAREERILGPLTLTEHLEKGMRVDLHYPPAGETYRWRLENICPRSIDGFEGYAQLELADYGD